MKYVMLRPSKGELDTPKDVTTDRGRVFMSNDIMATCRAMHLTFKPKWMGWLSKSIR